MSRGIKQDLRGRIFGWFLVIDKAPRGKSYDTKWTCMCKCGEVRNVYAIVLRNGTTKSCRCYCKFHASKRKFKHGLSRHRAYEKTPEYNSWVAAKGRCFYKKHKRYHDWGGRGIVMCDGWRYNFWAFFHDMGKVPPGHTLDRIDNDLNYSCGKCSHCLKMGWVKNCRWYTPALQALNRRDKKPRKILIDDNTVTL